MFCTGQCLEISTFSKNLIGAPFVLSFLSRENQSLKYNKFTL